MEDNIILQIKTALEALCDAGHLKAGSLLAVGCSTSEIVGEKIGKGSVPALGPVVAGAVLEFCREKGIDPVFQCCEHLNRALVVEKSVADRHCLTLVNAVPRPKAGGSVPTAAWQMMTDPCLCLKVQADAGIDIGDTLIGMHLRPVAVPVRCDIRQIGQANLVMAFSRLPYIGGSRAVYEEN